MRLVVVLVVMLVAVSSIRTTLGGEYEITAKAQTNGTKPDGTRDSDHSELEKVVLS